MKKTLMFFISMGIILYVLCPKITLNASLIKRTNQAYLDSTIEVNYDLNKLTEVIIELDGEVILDTYDEKCFKTINDYLKSTKGSKIVEEILSKQNELINYLNKLDIEIDFTNTYHYYVAYNAISVKTKPQNLSKIKNIPGVSDVFVSNYYLPSEVDISSSSSIEYDRPDVYMNTLECNELGYTGKGTSVAIIDTGMDVTHLGFSKGVASPKYTLSSLDELIKGTTLNALGVLGSSAVYYNEKIPYAFDYADNDNNVYYYENQHGCHVAGIVGANAYKTRGVAPDTQIFAMKVFPDEGVASETYILAALEDCLKLDVDVVNMSLGSACGSSYVTGEIAKVYNKIKEQGMNLVVACGNDHAVGVENMYGTNLPLASAPDYGLVASPSTYGPSLSVASVENKTHQGMYIDLNGYKIPYAEAAQLLNYQINTYFDNTTQDVVLVPNYGKLEDYNDIDVTGKIALVSRGEISFSDKHDNAYRKGAIGLIVYNPVDETFISMQIDNMKIPSVFIQKSSFDQIITDGTFKLSFAKTNYGKVPNIYAGLLSGFSSYGTTRDLEIKPEITGPGGFIYSTIYDNQYEEQSGTSMAAPNIAGGMALIIQYLNETYPSLSRVERVKLANNLIMSTSNPMIDLDGNYVPVRAQGSGVADILKAITTKTYIEVTTCERPKAELGSSIDAKFSYQFTITNNSTSSITYDLSTIPFTDDAKEIDGIYFSTTTSRTLNLDEYIITYSNNVTDSQISILPGNKETITVNIEMTSEFKNYQNPIFTNGSYVEGYTFIKANEDESLVIPFLGFYGDFDNLPLFEGDVYNHVDGEYNMMGCFGAVFDANTNGSELGLDPINEVFYKDKIYFSRNGMKQNLLTTINGLYRNVDYLTSKIYDEENNLIYENTELNFRKSFFYTSSGQVYFALDTQGWDGTKLDGSSVLNGEKYRYVTTCGFYEYGTDKVIKEESWEFNFTIDSNLPTLDKYQIITEDGIDYLELTVSDNYEPCIITVYDYGISEQVVDPICHTTGEAQTTVRFKLEDINNNISTYGLNNSHIKVYIEDWAHNFIYETISIGPSSIKATPEQKVAIGGKLNLDFTVVPSTTDKTTLKYTSSDERIAKVNNEGVVTGISEGVAIITIKSTNGLEVKVNVNVGGKIDNKITITSGDFEIEALQKTTLKVIFDPIDTVDKSVTWTSSNPSVAQISSYGYLEALKPGKTTITARSASGKTSKIVVTVTPPKVEYLYIFAYQTTFYVGYRGPIGDISIIPQVEDYSNVIFTSSNDKVIKVFNDGTMEAVGVGEAVISISSLDGKIKNSVEFIVAKINQVDIVIDEVINVEIGNNYLLNPTILPVNATNKDVTYTGYNEEVITISENTLTGIKVGTTNVTINGDGISKNIIVNVLPKEVTSITSSMKLVEIKVGEEFNLTYDINPIDATYQQVIWKASDSSIVQVYGGKIKGIKEGVTSVSVTTLNGLEYIYYISVIKDDTIPSISFANVTINKGNSKYLDFDLQYKDKLKFIPRTDQSIIIANDKIYALNEGITIVDVFYNDINLTSFEVTITQANKGCRQSLTIIINLSILLTLGYMLKKKH